MRRDRIIRSGLIIAGIIWINIFATHAQRQIEELDRGLVAIKTGNGVYLSWRVLGHEYLNTSYNVYRESTKLNTEPITGASCYTDLEGTIANEYSVAAITDDVEQPKSAAVNVWGGNYQNIPLQRPTGGTTPDGVIYSYNANDLSVGDLDGDGQYELILKWDPSNSKDNSHSGYTGKVYLDAYEMDGTLLWRIDLGINIRAGAHYTQFMVYDLDGDGKAEVACKTADGTVDGVGTLIGDASKDYRNDAGRILSGPEFLTVFDGETGAALATTNYIPARGSVSSWGDSYGNRVDRFLACVAYLDGQHPSLVMCRGYYTRTVLAAWDWKNGTLSSRWVFDTWNGYSSYEGQGNHGISVADVDEDGKDEIIYGAMAIDDDGGPLWNTGLHHGDAMHVSDIDPNRPGLEKWGIHEGSGIGSALLDARTGEIIWHTSPGDVGRGVSADLVAAYPGMECWGGTTGLRTATGGYAGANPSSSNFLIWWDADDLRELLNSNRISKCGGGDLLEAYNCTSNNGTKSTPAISADLIGDWREEVIFRTTDNNTLRLYTSPIPTTRRLYTLMHDPHYRTSIAWQNVAYNQPPHTGFFLGHNMADPPPPPIVKAKLKWSSGNIWDLTSKNWKHSDTLVVFENGDDVLFDLSGSDEQAISLSGSLSPTVVSFYTAKNYILNGPGSLTGSMKLFKAGSGRLALNSDHDFSGETTVWQGSLIVNGNLQQSEVSVHKDAIAGGSGTYGKGLKLLEEGMLDIGPAKEQADTLRIKDRLVAEDKARILFDLSDDSSGVDKSNDVLMVTGDLILNGTTTFEIQLTDDSLTEGQYSLIHYTGTFTGDINSISCSGIDKFPYNLIDRGDAIILNVIKLRDPTHLVWKGGSPNDWDLAGQLNWLNASVPDWFVPNDQVTFNDDGAPNTTINLVGPLYTGQIMVDASLDYTIQGEGVINGPSGMVKNGSGTLELSGNHEFTGPVHINGGTLKISELKNGGQPSPIGSSSADPANLILNGGTLWLTGSSSTNRGMTIGAMGGQLSILGSQAELTLNGSVTGEGLLTKTGNGDLTLSTSNDWSGGMLVKDGTVILGTEEANLGGLGTGKVSLQNAALKMLDDRNSYTNGCDFDLVVPKGFESWLHLDSRGSLIGTLEGSGILNVVTPWIRSEISGDWSGFEGRIKVSTNSDDATFLLGATHGFEKAAVDLGDNVGMIYMNSQNVSIKIGELNGTSGSELGAGGEGSNTITWVIGDRNTNSVFDGLISNRQFKNSGAKVSIIKTGTGDLTLSNANTYSGTTDIQSGILTIKSSDGPATGSGDVFIRSGASLRGYGSVSGNLTVESGASVTIGTGSSLDMLTVDKDAEFQSGSYLSIKMNPLEKTADKLAVNGHLRLDGILYVNNNDGGSFVAGDNYRIIEADSVSGNIKMIIPATPGDGLAWDTTWLSEYGYLGIVKGGPVGVNDLNSEAHFSICPNPGSSLVVLSGFAFPETGDEVLLSCYDPQGRLVYLRNLPTEGQDSNVSIDVRNWTEGIYLFILSDGNQRLIQQFIKQ